MTRPWSRRSPSSGRTLVRREPGDDLVAFLGRAVARVDRLGCRRELARAPRIRAARDQGPRERELGVGGRPRIGVARFALTKLQGLVEMTDGARRITLPQARVAQALDRVGGLEV